MGLFCFVEFPGTFAMILRSLFLLAIAILMDFFTETRLKMMGLTHFCDFRGTFATLLSIPSACNWNFDCYSWRQQSGQAICFDLPEKNVDRMLRFALFCWILVDTLQSFSLLSLQLQLWMIFLKTTICSALCFNPSDKNVN